MLALAPVAGHATASSRGKGRAIQGEGRPHRSHRGSWCVPNTLVPMVNESETLEVKTAGDGFPQSCGRGGGLGTRPCPCGGLWLDNQHEHPRGRRCGGRPAAHADVHHRQRKIQEIRIIPEPKKSMGRTEQLYLLTSIICVKEPNHISKNSIVCTQRLICSTGRYDFLLIVRLPCGCYSCRGN